MSEMRLIVAGAGGRMGRALSASSPKPRASCWPARWKRRARHCWARTPACSRACPNGVELSADLWALSAKADGILDFTVPAATIANVAIAAERGLVHIIGTTGISASDEAVIRSVTSRAIVVNPAI